ncbi:MAG: hypothetical protein V6017_01780 [Candidatus Dasytiphilus stammeri]
MLINFSKMHVLGNDFMIIDTMTQKLSLSPEIIQKLANHHIG